MRNFFSSVAYSCLIILGGVLMMTSSVCADVRMELPTDVDVFAVNGEIVMIENVVQLPDGVSQIVVRYDGLLHSGDKNSAFPDQVQSAAYVIKFDAADEVLQLIMPQFREAYDVVQFDKNPDILILAAEGKPVDFKYERLESQGFAIFRDFERELERFNKTDSPAAVPPVRAETWQARTSQGGSAATAPRLEETGSVELIPPSMTPSQQDEATSMSVQMLKFWWQQADDVSRQQFLDSIDR